MNEDTQLALSRLVALAMDDGEASKAAADFLLAWWKVETYGGFGPSQAWLLDDQTAADLAHVFAYVVRNQIYPDTVMDHAELVALARRWRPDAPSPA